MKALPILAALVLMPAAVHAATPAPDAEHRVLSGLAGHWSVEQSLWLDGATAPKRDTGLADFAMILKGRHLQQRLTVDDGTGFEGLGTIGYDTASGTFFSTWMDVNFPGMVLASGGYDGGAKAYVLRGRMGDVPVREVLSLIDADHIRYEFYETHKGSETLAVRLDYSRVK